jgi:V/A-type H+-transporting ATPase subunit F
VTGIFAVAEEELVLAFRLAGAEGRAVSGRDEALAVFRAVTQGKSMPDLPEAEIRDAKILVLSNEVSDMIAEEAREWQLSGGFPLIVEIPGLLDSNPDRKGLVDAIREAVGISV